MKLYMLILLDAPCPLQLTITDLDLLFLHLAEQYLVCAFSSIAIMT